MTKKSSAQLDREIEEALVRGSNRRSATMKTRGPSHDEIHYYMSEACPHFAIALQRLTNWRLAMLVDEAVTEEWDGEEYPTIAHVFTVRPDGTAVDVKGPRSVAAIKKDFFDLEEPRVERVDIDELTSMMGDGKPLYACGLTELNDAKRLIKRHADFYLT